MVLSQEYPNDTHDQAGASSVCSDSACCPHLAASQALCTHLTHFPRLPSALQITTACICLNILVSSQKFWLTFIWWKVWAPPSASLYLYWRRTLSLCMHFLPKETRCQWDGIASLVWWLFFKQVHFDDTVSCPREISRCVWNVESGMMWLPVWHEDDHLMTIQFPILSATVCINVSELIAHISPVPLLSVEQQHLKIGQGCRFSRTQV